MTDDEHTSRPVGADHACAEAGGVTASVRAAVLRAIKAVGLDVVVEVAPHGAPAFSVDGIHPAAVRESAVRVRCALARAGVALPRRVAVHVTPTDVPINAPALDLPIAIGVLVATNQIPEAALDGVVLVGELSVDGELRRVAGALPMALHAARAGARALLLPADYASEAATVTELPIFGASTLADVVAHLRGERTLPRPRFLAARPSACPVDLAEVRGLEPAKRALEVAAAGGHNLLLVGSPGAGTTLLARCLPTILPPLDEAEAMETTAIYSAAGKLDGVSRLASRPFRAPHHDVSVAGLVGGGTLLRPGEVALAHNGVLLLDELPEFRRPALDALRKPLEEHRVTIVRARAALSYPARFALVGATAPCPCGYRGSPLRACACGDEQVRRYRDRIASVLPWIDLHVELPHVDYRTLRAWTGGESSETVRARVVEARAVQARRLAGTGKATNGEMRPRELRAHCALDGAAEAHLEACVRRFGLAGPAVHAILRLARTIADLAGRERIIAADVAEAVALRALDREGI